MLEFMGLVKAAQSPRDTSVGILCFGMRETLSGHNVRILRNTTCNNIWRKRCANSNNSNG